MALLRRVSVPALLLTFLAGCAAPVHYEYNNAPYASWHSFAWKSPTLGGVRNPILDSGILSTRVERAVLHTLTALGYHATKNPDQADFVVTYHTALATWDQGGPSFGFAYGTFGPGYNTVFISQPGNRQIREGSLILDVIDAHSGLLVWRGWITSALEQSNYSQQAVDRAVLRIFSKFPPPAKS